MFDLSSLSSRLMPCRFPPMGDSFEAPHPIQNQNPMNVVLILRF